MALVFIAVIGLIGLSFCSGSQSWPELNPALQQYQDFSKCFPLAETWYTLYRNFETDPAFGGTAKCVKISEPGQPDGETHTLQVGFGDQTGEAKATLKSSPGYTSKNILSITPQGGPELQLYSAYIECGQCGVLRATYISNSSCILMVPESQVQSHSTCCDFIFDLLCGTGKKYQIYDSSCQA